MESPPQESDQPTQDDPAGGPPPTPDDADSGIGDSEHDEESAGEDPAS